MSSPVKSARDKGAQAQVAVEEHGEVSHDQVGPTPSDQPTLHATTTPGPEIGNAKASDAIVQGHSEVPGSFDEASKDFTHLQPQKVLPELPNDVLKLGLKDKKKLDLEIGDISQKHAIDERIRNVFPEGSSKYAYAYSTKDLPNGAFVYYDKSDKVVGIREITAKQEDADTILAFPKKASGSHKDLKADQDCPDGPEGYHDGTLWEDVAQYCWMPECKLLNDKRLGCWMYKMKGFQDDSEYRVYLTSDVQEAKSSALRPASCNIALMAMVSMFMVKLQ